MKPLPIHVRLVLCIALGSSCVDVSEIRAPGGHGGSAGSGGAGGSPIPSGPTAVVPPTGTGGESPGGRPTSILYSDFDGDAISDEVIVDNPSGRVAVFLGAGGGFVIHSDTIVENWLAVSDLNGDGSYDLVAATLNPSGGGCDIQVFEQEDDGTGRAGRFGPPLRYSLAGVSDQVVSLADISILILPEGYAGSKDIYVLGDGIGVFRNRGDGTFELMEKLPSKIGLCPGCVVRPPDVNGVQPTP